MANISYWVASFLLKLSAVSLIVLIFNRETSCFDFFCLFISLWIKELIQYTNPCFRLTSSVHPFLHFVFCFPTISISNVMYIIFCFLFLCSKTQYLNSNCVHLWHTYCAHSTVYTGILLILKMPLHPDEILARFGGTTINDLNVVNVSEDGNPNDEIATLSLTYFIATHELENYLKGHKHEFTMSSLNVQNIRAKFDQLSVVFATLYNEGFYTLSIHAPLQTLLICVWH